MQFKNQNLNQTMNRSLNKCLYKLELYVLRIIPILLAICSLLHTILFHMGFNTAFLVSLGKVSFLTLGFLYISSYAFHFCGFHRVFLHYILTVNIINYVETQFGLPFSNDTMLGIYIAIALMFLFIIIFKYKCGCDKENCCKPLKKDCRQD